MKKTIFFTILISSFSVFNYSQQFENKENTVQVKIDNIFKAFPEEIPVGLVSKTSVSQTLYYPNEVKYIGGLITGLQYKSSFEQNISGNDITVWIGETDETELSGDWIPPSSLTQVFNGIINFWAGNAVDVYIPFQTQYQYKGKTLVIYIYCKKSNNSYVGGVSFFVSYYYNYNNFVPPRTMWYSSKYFSSQLEIDDPMNPPNGERTELFTDITLFFDVAGLGSITGIVTDEITGESIKGVELKIEDRFIETSDTNGEYLFQHLNTDEHEITLRKFGYYDKTVTTEISGDETTTQNITLTPRNTYIVSGKVTDNKGNEIKDVSIFISGYSDFWGTTNKSGNFSIFDIYDFDIAYKIAATKQGYMYHIGNVEVNGNNVTYNIILEEIIYAIDNVLATEVDGNAVVEWTTNLFTEFRYDSGIIYGWVGCVGGTEYSLLGAAYQKSASLTKMGWLTLDKQVPRIEELVLWVLGLDESGVPDRTKILNKVRVPASHGIWAEYEFPEPVYAPFGFYIALSGVPGNYYGAGAYIGICFDEPNNEYPFTYNSHFHNFNVNHSQYPFIPTEYGYPPLCKNLVIRAEGVSYGELTKFGYEGIKPNHSFGFDLETGQMQTLIAQNIIVDEIEGISYSQPSLMTFEDTKLTSYRMSETASQERSKSMQSYSVYRLKPTEDEKDWILLADNYLETTFTDYSWSSLPAGQYQYAIKAIYDTGISTVISKVISKRGLFYVTFVITDESNNSIEDATIIFDGKDLSDNDNIAIVPKGEYPYIVSKEGYNQENGTVNVVNKDVEEPVKLSLVGIKGNTLSSIILYPNPFTNEINISNPDLVKSVKITNLAGQTVRDVVFDGKTIIIEKLSSGVYFVEVEGGDGGMKVFKMVRR